MAIREGRWDCPTCGTRGLLGRDTKCQNCGATRPEGIKFYLPENAPKVTNPDQLATAKAGADWICDYCGSSNRAVAPTCSNCGAPQGEKRQAVQAHPLPNADPAPSSPAKSHPKKPRRKLGCLGWGFLATVVALIIFWFQPQQIDATVTQTHWQRSIEIEQLTTVTESDWSVPDGGHLLSQQEAIHHYERILEGHETRTREVSEEVAVGSESYVCGTVDLGNGFFEDQMCDRTIYETRTRTETYNEPIYRDEPVYQTQYTYEIDRWFAHRMDQTDGQDLNPYWPTIELGPKEREGVRRETYTAYFDGENGESYQIKMPLKTWVAFEVGSQHRIVVNRAGDAWLPDE